MSVSLSLGSTVPPSQTMKGKRVLLAEPRGYCAGVDRAVDTVTTSLQRYGAPIYVRKEIVHNKHVVETLQEKGAIFVSETDEVPLGSRLVYSAHGVSPAVRESASSRELQTIDATCPLVTKVHQEVKRFARGGYHILLVGHEGHEEVEGTSGEAPEAVTVIDGVEAARTIEIDDAEKLIWLSQTTLSVDETTTIVSILKDRFPQLIDPPSDDICYATQNRQNAVKAMASECDLVIIVGSTNSSNSQRLVEVGLQAGARASYLVDYAKDIKPEWLEGVQTVGISSGASVPEILVEGVIEHLRDYHDFSTVQSVTTAQETLVFALPRELR